MSDPARAFGPEVNLADTAEFGLPQSSPSLAEPSRAAKASALDDIRYQIRNPSGPPIQRVQVSLQWPAANLFGHGDLTDEQLLRLLDLCAEIGVSLDRPYRNDGVGFGAS